MLKEGKEADANLHNGVAISIKKIEELAFRNAIPVNFEASDAHEQLQIGISYGFKPVPESDRFDVNISATYEFNGNEIMGYQAKVTFVIENLSTFLINNGNQFTVNPDFIPFLLNTSIGALRGMLALKTASTALHNYPLPIIDMNQLLKSAYIAED